MIHLISWHCALTRLTLGVSIHEHNVLITLAACVCSLDQAEALASTVVLAVVVVFVVVVVVFIVVVVVVVFVVVVVLVVATVEGATRFLTPEVQGTGYTAVQKACAIGNCLRIGLSSP